MNVIAPMNPTTLFSANSLAVVITGGGSELGKALYLTRLKLICSCIGLAIASALYQNGASRIYLLNRRLSVLQDAVKKLESSTATSATVLAALACDVTDLDPVKVTAAHIEKETGHVDVLINNAGIISPRNSAALHAAESIVQLRDAMVSGWEE